MRLGPVIGRKQQMIKLKGTTLYPPAIFDVLNEIDWIENYIIEVNTGKLGTDELTIKVGCQEEYYTSEKRIKDHFRAKLRVAPEIEFFKPSDILRQQLPENTRKPINFIDHRTI